MSDGPAPLRCCPDLLRIQICSVVRRSFDIFTSVNGATAVGTRQGAPGRPHFTALSQPTTRIPRISMRFPRGNLCRRRGKRAVTHTSAIAFKCLMRRCHGPPGADGPGGDRPPNPRRFCHKDGDERPAATGGRPGAEFLLDRSPPPNPAGFL